MEGEKLMTTTTSALDAESIPQGDVRLLDILDVALEEVHPCHSFPGDTLPTPSTP